MITEAAIFSTSFAALYVGHHIGDYWVQTDHQAQHKGLAGREGRDACLAHVISYLFTQIAMVITVNLIIGTHPHHWWSLLLALTVSGVTHYAADRREFGLMFKIARKLGKGSFMKLGVPRDPRVIEAWFDCPSCEGRGAGGDASGPETNGQCWDCRGGGKLPSDLTITDNPSLGTGAWALDQSWHLFFGVFVPALLLAV